MAVSKLILQIGEIPHEGLFLEGELDRTIFDIKDMLAKPLSPLSYKLKASVVDGYLVLKGRLAADFELICGGTTTPFKHAVVLDPYLESLELETGGLLDLTDQLREDILLALPAYPRAPDIEAEAEFPPSEDDNSGRSEWDALDGLKTND